jgi:hypothetical protein
MSVLTGIKRLKIPAPENSGLRCALALNQRRPRRRASAWRIRFARRSRARRDLISIKAAFRLRGRNCRIEGEIHVRQINT